MNIQDLPVESIVRIFSFLDYNDLLSVSSLNRFLHDVYENFPELQYSFALQAYGMLDSDPSLDILCKLEELERRERAWRTMDLSRRTTVKVQHRTSHIYDLSGGIYLLGDCKTSLISRDTHTLRFYDLSTCASGPELRDEPWPEMRIDANIVDVGFGLSEFDLIAVVGVRPGQHGEPDSVILCLRELSTGGPHPLARNPDIVIDPVSGDHGKLSIMLEIVGPRLLLLLTWNRSLRFQRDPEDEQDKLLLFNWWEGTMVTSETAAHSTWNGFVFLSPELALLPDKDHGLEIIGLPDVTKGYSSKGFERLLRLSLPALQSSVQVGSVQCRAEPNPFGAPHPMMLKDTNCETEFAQRMHARRRRSPVVPDPMKTVVLLQMYFRENTGPNDPFMGQFGILRHNVSMVVHREFLLRLVDMFANKPISPSRSIPNVDVGDKNGATANTSLNAPSEENIDTDINMDVEKSVPSIPWAQWGPYARWMADDTHVSNWITTSAGQRYVGSDEEGHIIIKDFNPITVRRARAGLVAARSGGYDNQNHDPHEWDEDGSKSRDSHHSGLKFDTIEDESVPEPGPERGLGPEIEPVHSFLVPEMDERTLAREAPESRRATSRSSSLPPLADASWKSVHVVEGYNEVEGSELSALFSEECRWPLPCVEYISRNTYDFHGLMMDEERIIGLTYDINTGAIVKCDVFTL